MKFQKSLKVPVEVAEQMEALVATPNDELDRDEAVFDREVMFDDGKRMVIQVVAPNEPEEESCWTQGVLFSPEGNELGVTDVGESFLGEYSVFHGEDEYEVTVETNMRDFYEGGGCPDCGEPIDALCRNGESCPNCEHVFIAPNRYPVKLLVSVEAPARMLPDEVVSMVNTIINAGLSDAADSAELADEDQMNDPDSALDLNITSPELLADDVYYQPDGAGDPDAGTSAAKIMSFHVYRNFHNARKAHPDCPKMLAFTGDDIQQHKFID